ncbi:PLP-dependent aminotransferase family protein [Amycolatopsis sp. DG1A-15b]|uniref:MocR-like pyridoxine biosynthesis transcription factor PdxR n=1 Tax=Amycolatopsis sp. DG1A-15b TaxID=3052846 RepID=UPI00255C276A|nr:PLP-dependent aminotransferase family protein [Amycolatopsis sp. DG1A-15b]WIX85866.1 PLP-dependent aminotransferase family protein [Amycolatopsis sp. DG1A-15b]
MPESQTDWGVLLELSGPGPKHEQLARALRQAIRDGVLTGAVPPSRRLAADLGCSRWVVTQAYAQLVAEGYLAGRTGSATRVRPVGGAVAAKEPAHAAPARYDLAPGLPDLRNFPRRPWAEAVREVLATTPHTDFGLPEPGGHPRLRRVLGEYLRRVRGAAPGTVLVCGGVTDGVTGVCRALVERGSTRLAVEDPGWTRLRRAAEGAGMTVDPVPVDDEGIDVGRIPAGVRAVLVTPAHQFPTGSVLSPRRRAELLGWARDVDGLILEDDYDAEFRYDRRPVGTVQGTDPARVALFGSVSKTLSPALGLGWAVLPPQWTVRAHPPPVVDQLALAGFVESGGYDRYLRGARLRYRARRDRLVAALGPARLSGAAAGLHLLLHLDQDAAAVARKAKAAGVKVADLDGYRTAPGEPALVLGYGNLADSGVEAAARLLRQAMTTA